MDNKLEELEGIGKKAKNWLQWHTAQRDGVSPFNVEDLKFEGGVSSKYLDRSNKFVLQRIYPMEINKRKDQIAIAQYVENLANNKIEPLTAGNLMASKLGLDKAGNRLTLKAGRKISTAGFVTILKDLEKKTGLKSPSKLNTYR